MSQMIKLKNEYIRINPKNNSELQNSKDARNWNFLFCDLRKIGFFYDIAENGKEILVSTTRSIFVSKNGGRNWCQEFE